MATVKLGQETLEYIRSLDVHTVWCGRPRKLACDYEKKTVYLLDDNNNPIGKSSLISDEDAEKLFRLKQKKQEPKPKKQEPQNESHQKKKVMEKLDILLCYAVEIAVIAYCSVNTVIALDKLKARGCYRGNG